MAKQVLGYALLVVMAAGVFGIVSVSSNSTTNAPYGLTGNVDSQAVHNTASWATR